MSTLLLRMRRGLLRLQVAFGRLAELDFTSEERLEKRVSAIEEALRSHDHEPSNPDEVKSS